MNKRPSAEAANARNSKRPSEQRRTSKVRQKRKPEAELVANDRQHRKPASPRKNENEPRKRTAESKETRPKRPAKSTTRKRKVTSDGVSKRDQASVAKQRPPSKRGQVTKVRQPSQHQRDSQKIVSKKGPRKKRPVAMSTSQGNKMTRNVVPMTRSEMKAKQQPTKTKGPLRTFFSVICHIIIVCYVLLVVLLSGVYVLFQNQTVLLNHQLISAQDNGLAGPNHGAIHAGDLLVVAKKTASQFKRQERIALRDPISEQTFVRRFVGLETEEGETYLQVTGDTQAYGQVNVSPQQVIGAVQFTLPKLAAILLFIQTNLWLTVAFGLIFFIWLLVLRAYLFT